MNRHTLTLATATAAIALGTTAATAPPAHAVAVSCAEAYKMVNVQAARDGARGFRHIGWPYYCAERAGGSKDVWSNRWGQTHVQYHTRFLATRVKKRQPFGSTKTTWSIGPQWLL